MYADSTAIVGPLSLRHEPGTYDLCAEHWEKLSPPRGWQLVREPLDAADPRPSDDDLAKLADAVREAGLGASAPEPTLVRRVGHLGVVADPGESRGRS